MHDIKLKALGYTVYFPKAVIAAIYHYLFLINRHKRVRQYY